MTDPPVEDLLARLERERQDADRRYNEALTAVDRAIQTLASWPPAPPPPDEARAPEINRSWNILPDGPPPIDRSLKGRLRGLVWRLVGPPLETQRTFNALVVEFINRKLESEREHAVRLAELTGATEQQFEALVHFESLLVQYLQTITAYVESRDRSIGGTELRQRVTLTEQRLLAVMREIQTVREARVGERPTAAPTAGAGEAFGGRLDSMTYVGFEDRFRGPEREIRGRVQDYVPIFAGATNVLDVGCGRGELLEALKERGIAARGIDSNASMVELCRSRGFDVELNDALSYLGAQPDGSIGGLSAIQVVEHFEPGYLIAFLGTAFHKMMPGAAIVLETINPACWMAFFETYIRDLTHQRPLHPDTLRFLVESSGFTAVDVQFRQPVTEGDRLERVKLLGDSAGALPRNLAQLADAVNANADKLNTRLFSSMDYVVIARR